MALERKLDPFNMNKLSPEERRKRAAELAAGSGESALRSGLSAPPPPPVELPTKPLVDIARQRGPQIADALRQRVATDTEQSLRRRGYTNTSDQSAQGPAALPDGVRAYAGTYRDPRDVAVGNRAPTIYEGQRGKYGERTFADSAFAPQLRRRGTSDAEKASDPFAGQYDADVSAAGQRIVQREARDTERLQRQQLAPKSIEDLKRLAEIDAIGGKQERLDQRLALDTAKNDRATAQYEDTRAKSFRDENAKLYDAALSSFKDDQEAQIYGFDNREDAANFKVAMDLSSKIGTEGFDPRDFPSLTAGKRAFGRALAKRLNSTNAEFNPYVFNPLTQESFFNSNQVQPGEFDFNKISTGRPDALTQLGNFFSGNDEYALTFDDGSGKAPRTAYIPGEGGQSVLNDPQRVAQLLKLFGQLPE